MFGCVSAYSSPSDMAMPSDPGLFGVCLSVSLPVAVIVLGLLWTFAPNSFMSVFRSGFQS